VFGHLDGADLPDGKVLVAGGKAKRRGQTVEDRSGRRESGSKSDAEPAKDGNKDN
jgi:hypothetical protein